MCLLRLPLLGGRGTKSKKRHFLRGPLKIDALTWMVALKHEARGCCGQPEALPKEVPHRRPPIPLFE